MQLDGCIQSTQSLVSMMPTIVDELIGDCQDDKYPGDHSESDQEKNSSLFSSLIIVTLTKFDNNINISLDSSNTNLDTQLYSLSEKKTFWPCLLTKKCLLLLYILFGLTLAVLIFLTIGGMKRIHTLEDLLRDRQNLIVNKPNQNNQNVTQLTSLLEQTNAAIEKLNKTFNELQKQTSRIT